MKTIYIDCGMGAAGDMLTAALLELVDDPDAVIRTLNEAFDGRAVLSVRKDQKCGVTGSHVTVSIGGEVEGEGQSQHPGHNHADHSHEHPHDEHAHHHHHTDLAEVEAFIRSLPLPRAVLDDALTVYSLIAQAESKVHGQPIENIHFHEVGTLDAMADVVSVCYLMHVLAPERVFASPVHVGSGTVHCAHGILPVPAPATQELLKDIPIYSGEVRGELCTPTGAALLRRFVDRFGEMPVMRVSRIGYGTGTKDFPRANLLRVLLGEVEAEAEQILELRCNLDDMTAEEIGYVQEKLFELGALDVYTVSIGMKKNRPAVLLTCMCYAAERDVLVRCLFRHTTTLGIRESVCRRYRLSRSMETADTPYGTVRIKRSEGYGVCRDKPEYEDLARIASEQDLSLREVKALLP